jgi:hypothetical protein
MGMFDTFILQEEAICPSCGKNLGKQFQSKSLECLLHCYCDKDNIKASVANSGSFQSRSIVSRYKDCEFEVYTFCMTCSKMVYKKAKIKNYVLKIDKGIYLEEN